MVAPGIPRGPGCMSGVVGWAPSRVDPMQGRKGLAMPGVLQPLPKQLTPSHCGVSRGSWDPKCVLTVTPLRAGPPPGSWGSWQGCCCFSFLTNPQPGSRGGRAPRTGAGMVLGQGGWTRKAGHTDQAKQALTKHLLRTRQSPVSWCLQGTRAHPS